MRQLLLMFCLVFGASLVLAAPIPKSLKKKKGVSLEGRWLLAATNYNGQRLNGNANQHWVINGEELGIEDGNNGIRRNNGVNYKLAKVEGDGDNCVDWTIEYTNGRPSNYVYRGRVNFVEDGFDFVFSASGRDGARPETVEAGPSRYLYTFKRATVEK
jgi:hypothetical protein